MADLPEAERIAFLIAGFLGNTLTEAEHDELDAWVVASEENTKLFEELTDENNIEAGLHWHRNLRKTQALQHIKLQLRLPRKPFWKAARPYAIAACLFTVLVGSYLFFPQPGDRKNQRNGPLATVAARPGSNRAVLLLDNGRTIILDSSGAETLVSEKGITVTKSSDGQLAYKGSADGILYHTLLTPRGGQYRVNLSDGTTVWLNAESSLRFPASFPAQKREVELRGEGYFEVAKNTNSPFRVKVVTTRGDSAFVDVTGTHFNVDAYGDEAKLKVTLAEGAVNLRYKEKTTALVPGQQALVNTGIALQQVDPETAMAWKNGLFLFRDASIRAIGAQVARWYDVEVVYKGVLPYHFNATIDRKEPLKNLLALLQETRRVQFTLDGKRLIIQP